MSKLIATLIATMFAATAFAQTNATPPTQPAAGTTANSPMKKDAMASDKPMSDAASEKKAVRAEKAKARKAKRDAKVGDKPLN